MGRSVHGKFVTLTMFASTRHKTFLSRSIKGSQNIKIATEILADIC